MKKLTTKEFLEKARKVHGNRYQYPDLYIDCRTKLRIICQKHGEFFQLPISHIKGHRCKQCGIEEQTRKSLTTKEFLEKARKVHGDKYNYSLVNYINNITKVKILCLIHGAFDQSPDGHISQSQGCPKCGGRERITNQEFLRRCHEVHGYTYEYLDDYSAMHRKIRINCKNHGEFLQTPHSHLKGNGCSICSVSHGEKIIENFFQNENIVYEYQKTFPKCKDKYPLKFDFYLPDHNLCIEYNGRQHYEPVQFGGISNARAIFNFQDQKRKDKIKKCFCKKNNIGLLIISFKEKLKLKDKIIKKLNSTI